MIRLILYDFTRKFNIKLIFFVFFLFFLLFINNFLIFISKNNRYLLYLLFLLIVYGVKRDYYNMNFIYKMIAISPSEPSLMIRYNVSFNLLRTYYDIKIIIVYIQSRPIEFNKRSII